MHAQWGLATICLLKCRLHTLHRYMAGNGDLSAPVLCTVLKDVASASLRLERNNLTCTEHTVRRGLCRVSA